MSSAASLTPAFSPLDLQSRPLAWRVGAVVLGTLAYGVFRLYGF